MNGEPSQNDHNRSIHDLQTISVLGSTPEERLAVVWGFCMEYYGANPVDATTRYTRLYLSMFSSLRSWRTSFPKLKGKAAQVKHLTPALAYAWSKVREVGNPKHDAVSLALDMSVQMDRVLDDHPGAVVLPNDASDDFIAVSFVFLNQYTRLATLYNTGGDMVFNVTVKSHMVAHIALRAGDLNPRRAWCFSGERGYCCSGVWGEDDVQIRVWVAFGIDGFCGMDE